MGNFELEFACTADDGSQGPFIRIIAAEDAPVAERIGTAMCGEDIATGRRLERLVRVTPTTCEPTMSDHMLPFPSIWGRVLHSLRVDPASVKFVYSYRIGLRQNPSGHIIKYPDDFEEPEICGFFRWKPRP